MVLIGIPAKNVSCCLQVIVNLNVLSAKVIKLKKLNGGNV